MKAILKQAILQVQPEKTYEKEILSRSKNIISVINKDLKNAKAQLGGSGAKGTWLKTFDADIFVKFNYKKYADKSDQLSDILEKFLKKHFKIQRLHGSRDYFQVREGKYTFEIVPILEIKHSSEAKNITDVSPLHSQFVSKHKKLVNEIRLTKQFFKAASAYGAESHIQGFSGYVCEILTIHYGSFEKLIKQIPKWKEKTTIDIENYYKGKNIIMELNKSKLHSPLIVIDPVQADRNAAAALSEEKFEQMKKRARAFLKKPSLSFFQEKIVTEKDLKKRFNKYDVIVLKTKPLNKKQDVAGAKLRKALHYLESEIQSHGFELKEADLIWNEKQSLLYFALASSKLSKYEEILGPFIYMKQHVAKFKKKYPSVKKRKDRLVAKIERKYASAHNLMKSLLKKSNVKKAARNFKVS